MGPVTAGLTLLSGGISAYSQIQAGRAAEAQSRREAEVIRRNAFQDKLEADADAQIAKANSARTLLLVHARNTRERKVARERLAERVASRGASGFSLDSQSFRDQTASMIASFEEDAAYAQFEAALGTEGDRMTSRGLQVRGETAWQAGMMTYGSVLRAGQQAGRNARLGAFSTGISTASSLSTQFTRKKA